MPQGRNEAKIIRDAIISILEDDEYISSIVTNPILKMPLDILVASKGELKFPSISVFYQNEVQYQEENGFITSVNERFYMDIATKNNSWDKAADSVRELAEAVFVTLNQHQNLGEVGLINSLNFKVLSPSAMIPQKTNNNWDFMITFEVWVNYEKSNSPKLI